MQPCWSTLATAFWPDGATWLCISKGIYQSTYKKTNIVNFILNFNFATLFAHFWLP